MSRKRCLIRYTVLFLIIFLFGFITFFIQGKSFVWESDGFRQYYPALSYLGRYYRSIILSILHGSPCVPMVDYTIGQGEDIITTLANYGLGDPLTLFSTFVPSAYTEYLYDFLVALRLYLSGISFLLYCREMKWKPKDSIYGALVYVFCGFAIWSVKDPFFLNAMIYLPLVLLGVERSLKKKGSLALTLSVLFCILSGYYFFYMIVLGALAYFVVKSVFRYGGLKKAAMLHLKEIWRDGIRCLLAGVRGVLMSGVLIVPLIYGYAASSRTGTYTSLYSLLLYPLGYYKNMVTKFVMVAENRDAGSVGYFSMSVIVFLALYVLFRKKDRHSVYMRNCVCLCFAAVASPLAGYVMNGFGYITNRFMFIPAFLLSAVLVRVLPDILALDGKSHKMLVCLAAAYAAVCMVVSFDDGLLTAVYTAVMLGGMIAVLFKVHDKLWRKRMFYGMLILNLIGNINFLYQPFGADMADAYLDAGSVRDKYISNKTVNLAGKLSTFSDDGVLGRLDVILNHEKNPNRSMIACYAGVSVYYSIINAGYYRYMFSLGNTPDMKFSHCITGNDGRTILSNLANVKYIVSRKKSYVPYGFRRVKGKKKLYKNKNKTSIGYFYDSYVSEKDYDESDLFERQNTLLESAVLEPDSHLYEKAKKSPSTTNGIVSGEAKKIPFDMTAGANFEWKKGELDIPGKKAKVRLSFIMEPGKEYYLRLTGLELEKAKADYIWAHVKMGDMKKEFLISNRNYDFYFGRNDYVVNLGSLPQKTSWKEGRELEVVLNGPAEYSLKNIELVEVAVDGVAEKMDKLCEDALYSVSVRKDGSVSAEVPYLSWDKIMCLAIPYKNGYRLFVDGKETEIEKINKMYIGAWMEEGEHSIRLEYRTPGLGLGFFVSLLGVVLTVLTNWKKRR